MTGGSADGLRVLHKPRVLAASERSVIEQLLAKPFRGRDAIREQLEMVSVIAEGDGDTRTLRLLPDSKSKRAEVGVRVPVEAEVADDDGVSIAVLLHVLDGLVAELEIYRVDGQPIRREDLGVLQAVVVAE